MGTINRSLEEKSQRNDPMEEQDFDSMPVPSLFLTPKANLQAGGPRLVDSSPPIILRKRAASPGVERDAPTLEVLKTATRVSSDRDEPHPEMVPAVSRFDDDDFILAGPSEVGMVSRDNSFRLEADYETDDTETGSLTVRCVMDEFSWELSAVAQDIVRQSEVAQFQDQEAQEGRFRPIQVPDVESQRVEKPRFTSLRLKPRSSRVDWEALQSANPFL